MVTSTHNNRNQITGDQPGGWMRVRGTTNEPATVRVRSNANPLAPATLQSGNAFAGWVTTTPGANSITVEAKDRSPGANTRTSNYTISVTGTSRTPTYDLNGNTTSNGTGQTYEWDAEDHLIKIIYADTSSTEFIYDGFSRRSRITEKNPFTVITSDKRYLWAGGNQPAEERDSTGSNVLIQYHPQGERWFTTNLFYTKDHGSIREILDSSGILQTRYDYDMWGKRVRTIGVIDSDVGYTGHHHSKSGLILTWYRAYDANSGTWLSADPLEKVTGEMAELLPEGANLYSYVGADPVNGWDPLGLNNKPKRNLNCNGFDLNSSRDEVIAARDAARLARNVRAAEQLQALQKIIGEGVKKGARFVIPLQAFLNAFEQSFGPLFPEEPCRRFD